VDIQTIGQKGRRLSDNSPALAHDQVQQQREPMKRQSSKAEGRIVSALTVVILLAVAAGLYLQIVLQEKPIPRIDTLPEQASVQVLEGDEIATAAPPAPAIADEPLPSDQMDIILQVFAPEAATD
jgi:hypothetical protein